MSDDLIDEDAGMLGTDAMVAAAGASLEGDAPNSKLDSGAVEHITCMNCGEPLTGPFCRACGQKHDDIRRPFWTFMVQLFDDVLSSDSRSWRTLGYLLFVPGKLSRDYNQGRRARFLPPLRLYLVLTVLFFLSLDLTSTALLDVELIRNDTRMAQLADRQKARAAKVMSSLADRGLLPKGMNYAGNWAAELADNMALKQNRDVLVLTAQQFREAAERDDLPSATRKQLIKSAEKTEARLAQMEKERKALEDAGVTEAARPNPITLGILHEEKLAIPSEAEAKFREAIEALDIDDLEDLTGLDSFEDLTDFAELDDFDDMSSAEQKAAIKKKLKELGLIKDKGVSLSLDLSDENTTEAIDDDCWTPSDNFPYCVNVRTFSPMAKERRAGIAEADLKLFLEEADEELGRDAIVGFARAIQDPKGFNKLFNDRLPWAMLVLLPIFALILRLFHWGGGRYYMNQVVFALHFHGFLFAQLIILVLVAPHVSSEILFEAFWIATSIYLVLALKVGQKQGLLRAFLKAGFIWVPYVILMTAVVSGFVFWGLTEA